MHRIYQEFQLNEPDGTDTEGRKRLTNAVDAWMPFLESLKERGYSVQVNMTLLHGVHTRILVGKEIHQPGDVKGLFWAFAKKYDLPFRSGDCFEEI